MAITLTEARDLIDGGVSDPSTAFAVLGAIGAHGTVPFQRDAARETLIRLLEKQGDVPGELHDLVAGLVREHGLFPYIRDTEDLFVADRIAYEAHRPTELPGRTELVFHAEQAIVYQRLLDGENVVLSAPTSFGKSLVIDAVLAARTDWSNAAVVVPTVALIDEMRRRLANLRDRYKIITHGSQSPGEKNLYVMTQERLLDLGELPPFDFFAIDEFYKLDPAHSDDRSNQLNVLFRRLHRTGAQFYLLGPNINSLTADTEGALRATFIRSDYTTVVTDVERVSATKEATPDKLAEVCRELGPQTIIFCKSPARTREVAKWLLDRGLGVDNKELASAAAWIAETYHPEWLVGQALGAGIGIHHGKLPRALAHHIVRLFNERRLPYLLVTSTLIEGVNTSARSVVVLDNKIGRSKYDYFTYANIRGRSGRMSQYFVGRVVVFNEPPEPSGLVVDVPVLSRSPQTPEEILIQLPWEELSEDERARLRPYYEQKLVQVETLRANQGIAPSRQLDAAKMIQSNAKRFVSALGWSRFPTSAQVKILGEVLFPLIKPKSGSQTVKTAKQLSARLNILRFHRGNVRAVVDQDISGGMSPDEAVEATLDFVRQWTQFLIPRGITAVERIAVDVAGRQNIADTRAFVQEVEAAFQPTYASVLEEYGLPLSVAVKLDSHLRLDRADGLDAVLERLRGIPPNPAGLGSFELEMLRDVQNAL